MWHTGLVAPQHVGSSWTRARTRVPCIGRRILNHCATREAPKDAFESLFAFRKTHYVDRGCPKGRGHGWGSHHYTGTDQLATSGVGREKEIVKGMEEGRLVGFSSRLARPEQGPSGFPTVPTASGTQMNLLSGSKGCGGHGREPSSSVLGAAAPAGAHLSANSPGIFNRAPWTIIFRSLARVMRRAGIGSNSILFLQDPVHSRCSTVIQHSAHPMGRAQPPRAESRGIHSYICAFAQPIPSARNAARCVSDLGDMWGRKQ